MTNTDYALIFINYLLEKVYKGISPLHVIQRRSKTGALARISPQVQSGIYAVDHIKHLGEFSELVSEFKGIFDEKLSHYNNTAFYDNLETIEIEDTLIDSLKVSGRYYEDTNRINLNQESINQNPNPTARRRNVLFHELIHMATSYTRGIINMCGFSQQIGKKYSKGLGLNEGYTELINQRYFARTIYSNDGVKISYPREQNLAYGIELLVGKETMEALFFNADLDGLITEMTKYMPIQEVNMLLNIADLYDKKSKDIDLIEASAKSIIANRLLQKNENLYQQGLISKEEYEFRLLETEMFTRGYFLRKSETGYELEPIFFEETKSISAEGYRVLQNHFKNSKYYGELYDEKRIKESKKQKLLVTFMGIEKAEKIDGVDMSQVETLEVIDLVSKDYKTTPRVSQNTDTELSDMIEELDSKPNLPPTDDTKKK